MYKVCLSRCYKISVLKTAQAEAQYIFVLKVTNKDCF